MAEPVISEGLGSIDTSSSPPLGHRLLTQFNISSGCTLSLASDDNETIRDLNGPGRLLGNILSGSGKRVERVIDRIAEELGMGPHMAAHRITAELHKLHIVSPHETNTPCRSEHLSNIRDHIKSRIISSGSVTGSVHNVTCLIFHVRYISYLLRWNSP
jgi:hypothetical protein